MHAAENGDAAQRFLPCRAAFPALPGAQHLDRARLRSRQQLREHSKVATMSRGQFERSMHVDADQVAARGEPHLEQETDKQQIDHPSAAPARANGRPGNGPGIASYGGFPVEGGSPSVVLRYAGALLVQPGPRRMGGLLASLGCTGAKPEGSRLGDRQSETADQGLLAPV
jgi:hypothetical protein